VTQARLLGLHRGPELICLVRHGQSVGNLADEQAREQGADRLELSARDADVELSPAGERQAEALARWLQDAPKEDRPTLVLTSPYRRAHDTARAALAQLDGVPLRVDERLRDRELGVLDLHTTAGVLARHPDEAARRHRLGKV